MNGRRRVEPCGSIAVARMAAYGASWTIPASISRVLVCGINDPLGSAEQLKTSPAVQGVCFAIGSDTARSARGAKEHAAAQIGGYLNHSGGSSSSRLSGCGGSSRSSAPAIACNVWRNTAFQGSSETSVVLVTKAGFVVIIPSKIAC